MDSLESKTFIRNCENLLDNINKNKIKNSKLQILESKLNKVYNYFLIDISHLYNNDINSIKEVKDILFINTYVNQFNYCNDKFNYYCNIKDTKEVKSKKTDTEQHNNICTCGSIMLINLLSSELFCIICATVIPYANKVKSDNVVSIGSFSPTDHFNHWWNQIMAECSVKELSTDGDLNGVKLIADIKKIILLENKILRLLTINDIRKLLKQLKKTELNKYIALVFKELTGISPPVISLNVKNMCLTLFIKVINVINKIDRSNRTNRNYYPFTITKLLDFVLDPNDKQSRKIFHFIYLQSEDTLSKDDEDWKKICELVPEIEYKGTNRQDLLRFGLND